MTRYDILDSATKFLRALRECSEAERNAAYQVIAGRANDSDYGEKAEPYSGLCVAIQAHEQRLWLDTKEAEVDQVYWLAAHECGECGSRGEAVAFNGPVLQRLAEAFLVQCVECGEVERLSDFSSGSDHATRRAESGYAQ
jgi:hypothetical protein